MPIEKYAFGATCIAAMIYSRTTYLHVQVVDDQTSPTKSTIHDTTDNEKRLTRMMLTALLSRHPTLNFFLIMEQKRRTGQALARLNG